MSQYEKPDVQVLRSMEETIDYLTKKRGSLTPEELLAIKTGLKQEAEPK